MRRVISICEPAIYTVVYAFITAIPRAVSAGKSMCCYGFELQQEKSSSLEKREGCNHSETQKMFLSYDVTEAFKALWLKLQEICHETGNFWLKWGVPGECKGFPVPVQTFFVRD